VSGKVAMIMAGGTGGHVFPALATARVLRDRGFDIVWLGTQRGIEARLVPAAGIPVEWLSVSGLRGKGLLTLAAAPFRLVLALLQAIRAVRKHGPQVVLGAGGFVSGPGGVAAWLLRRPLVVHEQNAVAGLTNRILARLATRVLEGFPGSFGPNVKAERVGNPVRPEIAAIAPPERRYAGREGRSRLLVFGGSQGAQRLNAVVPAAIAELPANLRPDVLHQTGARGVDDTINAYRSRGIEADVRPFIDDMAGAYGWADLAVCRSGALTIAELAAAGVPAILVPFPAAVDDHQTRNAEFVVQEGAAVLLAESALTPISLASTLRELLEAGRPHLTKMAQAARRTAIPDADQRLADACVAAAAGGAA
jgi:UDP-N-acetylglucosamine--N-acetylmuramyl-(pentapeptide) pyrophosphoryl-undecaprenol N-acetylglucosamine transferase